MLQQGFDLVNGPWQSAHKAERRVAVVNVTLFPLEARIVNFIAHSSLARDDECC
jgi:hypothetical protein